MRKKYFITGLIVGSISGFFLVQKNRKQISEIKEEITDTYELYKEVTSDWKQIGQQTTELISLVQTDVPEYIDDTKKQLNAFKFQAEPRLKLIKDQIGIIQSRLTDLSKENK